MFGQAKHSQPKETEVDLNRVVTPMLDMTFQILFFLIMNFHLPSPEGQIDLQLPQAEDAGSKALSAPEDNLDKPDSDEYLIRIFIAERGSEEKQGSIVSMSIRKKGDKINAADDIDRIDGTNDPDEYYSRLDTTMYGLVQKLRLYQPKEGGKQPTIKIECPKKLKYSELLKVMDVMRKLKFQNVGVVPVPKE